MDKLDILLVSSIVLIVLAIYIYIMSSVTLFAKRLGHSAFMHTIIGIFLTPFVPLLYLYCAGETDAHRKARIEQEEKWRLAVKENND